MSNKRLIVAMLLVSIASLGSMNVHADSGAIRVHNSISTTVTVNTESGYCCTAEEPGQPSLTCVQYQGSGYFT